MVTERLDMTKQEIVNNWHETLKESSEAFLGFAEGLNINEFTTEEAKGKRYVDIYNAHAMRIGENDGDKEKEIIETLAGCGVDFNK